MSAGPFQTRKATKEDSKLKMFIRRQNTTVHISRSQISPILRICRRCCLAVGVSQLKELSG